jgi:hypothetical protein
LWNFVSVGIVNLQVHVIKGLTLDVLLQQVEENLPYLTKHLSPEEKKSAAADEKSGAARD